MVSITLEVWGFCNFYTNFKYHRLLQVDDKQIIIKNIFLFISSFHSLSHVRLFATPWTTARQASLSITNSQSLPKLMSIKSVMPSKHILCRPLLLLPSIFPSLFIVYYNTLVYFIINNTLAIYQSIQSLSRVWPFATPCTVARHASLSITNSRSPPKPMSIESVMPSNHLILCRPLLLLPSIFPSIRVFSNESALHIRWPKYWSFSFIISPGQWTPRTDLL